MNSHTIESPMAHFNDDTSAYFRAVAAVAAVATSSACGSQILSNPALPTRSYSAPRTPSGGRSLNTATNGLDRSAAAAAGYIDGQPTDGSFIHAPTPLNRVNLDSLLGFISPPPPKVLNDVFFSPAHNESPNLYPFPVAPKYTKSQATTGYCSPTDTFLEPDYLDITSPSSELTIFDEATKNFAPTPESMAFWSSDESDSVAGSEFSTRLPSPAPSLVTEGVCGSISYKSTPDMTISPVDLTINGINDEKRSTPPLTDPLSESDASTKCDDIVEQTNDSRESLKPTIFEQLTGSGVDWCRYCGTTEGINWRPGPWGKRTLCNKHGCDYKGYGFASKMPRLNLRDFIDEPLASRIRPVLQSYCQECQSGDSFVDNTLVQCDGCHRAYHQDCYSGTIPTSVVSDGSKWYCNKSCQDNLKKQKIYVELPKKRLPFMCASKHSNSHQSDKAKSAASGGQAGLQNKNTSTTTPGYRSRKRIAKSSSSDDMAASQPRAKIRKSTRASRSSTKQQRQG